MEFFFLHLGRKNNKKVIAVGNFETAHIILHQTIFFHRFYYNLNILCYKIYVTRYHDIFFVNVGNDWTCFFSVAPWMSLLVYHKCFRNWSSLQILMPQHPGPGYDFVYKFMTRCLQMFYKTVSIYPDFLWNLTAAGLKVIYFACLGIVITNIALLWLPDKVISKAMASGMMWPAHLHKAKPRRTPHCCVLLANQILSIKSENTHSTEKCSIAMSYCIFL